MLTENDLLTERMQQMDPVDDPQNLASKKYFNIQLQLDQIQQDNYRYVIHFCSFNLSDKHDLWTSVIELYLSRRRKTTVVGVNHPNPRIPLRAPQSSGLNPAIFNCFINDFHFHHIDRSDDCSLMIA